MTVSAGAGLTPWRERFSVAGKVALVTGAGGGIGRAFTWGLAEAGAMVAAHDRTLDDLAPAVELLASDGLTASHHAADLVDVEACGRLVAEVHATHGRLDVLVNCAGSVARTRIADTDAGTFDRIVAVDVRAPYFLSQSAHRFMQAQGGGSIVNIGSVNSFFGLDTVSVYGLSKGALMQFTRAAAVEWAADGVRVNCITPGFIRTPINIEALWGDARRRSWIIDRVPMARPGVPDDLVGALLFLASEASAFVTGQAIVVDGGFLAGGSWDYQGPVAWSERDRTAEPEEVG
jgi:NAD(P)-dependent dehydrogenase (short-subunit alcohol dehydrogenase family)